MNISILGIACVEGIGPRSYFNLIQKFGSIEEALHQNKSDLMQIREINASQAKNIAEKEYESKVEIQLNWIEKKKGKIITIGDMEYPDILKQIYDPPLVLMCIGDFRLEDDVAFGVVGLRYPDDYGKKMCYKIAKGIAEREICIVNGSIFPVWWSG